MGTVSVDRLKQLVDRALVDEDFAERLFADPEGVARENDLSEDETLVVKQMSREQFETAKMDAAVREGSGELAIDQLEAVAGGRSSFSALGGIAAQMIIGRSIMSASGRSYASLTAAGCDCCAWKGGVNLSDALIQPV